MSNSGANYRRILLMALLAVLVALAIALGTLLALSRWAGMGYTLPLTMPVQPGDKVTGAWCSYEFDYTSLYCQGIVANQKIYFTNDAQTGRVNTISYQVAAVSVGDLINMWGEPNRMAVYGNIRRVYWDVKSALVYSKRFSPFAPAWFVSLGLQPSGQVWRGFTE